MKRVLQNLKFIIGTVLWILIIAAMFLVGWGMGFTSVDLSKANSKTGVVRSAIIQQSTGSKALPGQTDLIIYLDNEDNGFWIYRASHDYNDISSRLAKGTQITIYYTYLTVSGGYYPAYQIQANNAVIYSKDEYNRKEQLAGRFLVLPGSVIMFVMLIYQSYKKLFKNAPKPAITIE